MNKENKPLKDDKIVDPHAPDKRYKKKYTRQLIEYVNQSIRPDEQNIYKELVKVIAEENRLTKPQDILMLDVAIYDFLRIKRLQTMIMKDGEVTVTTSKAGNKYTKVNPAGQLLNSVETQFRNRNKICREI